MHTDVVQFKSTRIVLPFGAILPSARGKAKEARRTREEGGKPVEYESGRPHDRPAKTERRNEEQSKSLFISYRDPDRGQHLPMAQ
jgi:hypothetical protein